MTGKRRVGLGSVVVKQSGGGGAATASKQGGGNKLIGLISTKNRAINGAMVHNIRTRSDGGQSRHWFFCVNQLGGVGRKWGQSGPGNRGGVSAGCAALARQSRLDYPLGRHGGGGVVRPGRDTPAHMRALRAVAALQAVYRGTGKVSACPKSITVSGSASAAESYLYPAEFDQLTLTRLPVVTSVTAAAYFATNVFCHKGDQQNPVVVADNDPAGARVAAYSPCGTARTDSQLAAKPQGRVSFTARSISVTGQVHCDRGHHHHAHRCANPIGTTILTIHDAQF